MAPKKVTNVEKPRRKIVMTTVELKKELITKWEKGARVSDLAVQYGMAKSTIPTIQKNKKKNLMMVVVVLVNHNLPLVD